jgi:endonuclease/exonuclease/phosphatase family metal-dependent hydrolase
VATYNIHRGIGGDGRRDPARTSAVIRGLAAGVVALQEVDSRDDGGRMQMDYLAGVTGYTAIPGPTLHEAGGQYGNVLLSAHPVAAVRAIDLTVPGLEPRGAIDADIALPDHMLRVVATHLGLRAGERRRQVAHLLEVLGGDPREPTVLLGDFNEWLPWARSLRHLRTAFTEAGTPASFRAGFPLLALDRIFARPRGCLSRTRAVRASPARTASDHLPLLARYHLPPR